MLAYCSEPTVETAEMIDLLASIDPDPSNETKIEQMKYRAFRMRQEYYQRYNIAHPAIGNACVELAQFYEERKRYHAALGFYRYAIEIYGGQGLVSSVYLSNTFARIHALEMKLES